MQFYNLVTVDDFKYVHRKSTSLSDLHQVSKSDCFNDFRKNREKANNTKINFLVQ